MDPTDVLNRFPDDVLPPEGEFPSRKDLVTAINAWARDRGYAFVVKNSWKTSSGRTGVIYCCDRGTKPTSTTKIRKRNTTSRYTGCLFSVIAKEEASRTAWSLKYRPDHSHHEHNHEPSNALAHPTHRQLSSPDRSIVRQLANAGATPKVITSHLRNTTGTLATQKDIYNCIAQSKRELVQGQSNIHALTMQLESEGFWNRIRLDDSRVTAVLFAHPKSLEYLKSYSEVIILDCTYKTNKYNMPLLNAIGVDACQRSFCIAFAFLCGEEEADYQWVLIRLQSLYEAMTIDFPSVILTDQCLACMNAVASTFPQSVSLLCLWHINKAVLRHCMDAFTKDSKDHEGQEKWKEFYSLWHDLVASSNEDIYYQKLGEFKKKYLPDYTSQIGYITETWLDLYKDRFVKAWVDQHLHFNQFVTSRCEGIHQLIKSYLKTSQLNLFEAWRYIKLVVMNQLAELDSNRAKQQASFPLKLSGSIYGNIRGWISHEALRLVESQRSRLLHELPSCTGTFNRTLGLPCAHTIQPLIHDNQPLQIYHFHSHWRIQHNGNPQLLIEPAIQSSRLQATSVLPVTSTQREPLSRSTTRSLSPASPAGVSAVHTTTEITETTTQITTITMTSPVAGLLTVATQSEADTLSYEDPRAIYQRYKADREAWYATLPRGAVKTNQQYRKAMKLPQRYSKAEYEWCVDWKQMGRHCRIGRSTRDWTKEEMMRYLDFDKAENERVERNVEKELQAQRFTTYRGSDYVWKAAGRDHEDQQQEAGRPTADTAESAPLAVGRQSPSSTLRFNKFSVPGPLLGILEKQRQRAKANANEASPLEIMVDCTVKHMIKGDDDNFVRVVETSKGTLSWTGKKTRIILCTGAIANATILLNSFESCRDTVGRRLTGHYDTHISARCPVKNIKGWEKEKTLQVAAAYVAGKDPKTGLQYHVSVTAVNSPNPEDDAEDLARECPDYAAAATYDQLEGSENHVVFVCSALGEFNENNEKNHVTLNKGTDPTCNVTLQYTLSDEDRTAWDVMDQGTYDTIKEMAGGDAHESDIEWWNEASHKWCKNKPPVDTIRIPGVVHESST
ncbi:hypothetical protein ACKAV7_003731 [Fusarium commune]